MIENLIIFARRLFKYKHRLACGAEHEKILMVDLQLAPVSEGKSDGFPVGSNGFDILESHARKRSHVKARLESLLSLLRMHWDREPTPDPSQEGNGQRAASLPLNYAFGVTIRRLPLLPPREERAGERRANGTTRKPLSPFVPHGEREKIGVTLQQPNSMAVERGFGRIVVRTNEAVQQQTAV